MNRYDNLSIIFYGVSYTVGFSEFLFIMNLHTLTELLWGKKAKLSTLFFAAAILIFGMLGARDVWTQEHRWADIVSGMFARHDFLHPYLGEYVYYDKPLLSYWLIVVAAKIIGTFNTWALRLPSALAGLLALWSIYQIGSKQKSRELGLLSAWLLLTTYYFVFWARTSSADMLNVAGSLLAIAWYLQKRQAANFLDYCIFFIILAVTSLCKGLTGAIVPLIAVAVDISLQRAWRSHLRWPLLFALLPAQVVYFIPFMASGFKYGLYLVYKENILRYFEPFDHRGPLYTYFIYLPVYLLPWTVLFFPALWSCLTKSKWVSPSSKWIALCLLMTFLFFTFSGSRRSYYVLPIVPFASLLIADWILSGAQTLRKQAGAAVATIASFMLIFILIVALPGWYYANYGMGRFVSLIQQRLAEKNLASANVVMLDAESKINFYLQENPRVRHFNLQVNRSEREAGHIETYFPILLDKPANTIFISRKLYLAELKPHFKGYEMIELPQDKVMALISEKISEPVAFIPADLILEKN